MSGIKAIVLCIFIEFMITSADVEYERTGACHVS